MTRRQEPQRFAGKVTEKLLPRRAPEQLEPLAWQSRLSQRASSTLSGAALFASMPPDRLDHPAGSFGGLCASLQQRHPQGALTPHAWQPRRPP
jgi:hypothetical protein